MKKYFIKRTNLQTGVTEYYKNKTVAAWVSLKTYCWRFSKQGGKNIIARYNTFQERHGIIHRYELEAVEGMQ